jgi:hypothetical protein
MHTGLYAAGAVFAFATIALLSLRYFVDSSVVGGEDIRKFAGKVYRWFVVVMLVSLVWYAVSVASSNRIPRQTEDRSDIYRQVERDKAK